MSVSLSLYLSLCLCLSLPSLSLILPLSLESTNMSSREDLKKRVKGNIRQERTFVCSCVIIIRYCEVLGHCGNKRRILKNVLG